MKTLISVKFKGVKPGDTFRLSDRDSRAVVALGLAAYAPAAKPKVAKAVKPAGQYLRRDMVAEPRGTVTQPTFHLPSSGYAHPFKTDDGKA